MTARADTITAPEPKHWNGALAMFRAAHATLEATDSDEAETNGVVDCFHEATGQMIETPAPDGDALLFKLEYLFGDDPTACYCAEWINAVMADAHRLLWTGRA